MDNNYPPMMRPGGGFGFRDGMMVQGRFHHDGPPALAWVTFALLLLLTLSFFALVLSQWSARRATFNQPVPPPRFRFRGGHHRPDPLDVLRHRYARGEMSRDEFAQAMSDLGSEAPTVEEPPA